MDANGWSARKVADELSLANSTVVKALSLLELAPAVQGRVESGELTAAAAYEVSKLEDPGEQAEIAERVVAEKLTRDQTAAAVREKAGRKRQPGTAAARGGSAARRPASIEYRLDDGTSVTVSSPAAGGGQEAVVVALEQALTSRGKGRGGARPPSPKGYVRCGQPHHPDGARGSVPVGSPSGAARSMHIASSKAGWRRNIGCSASTAARIAARSASSIPAQAAATRRSSSRSRRGRRRGARCPAPFAPRPAASGRLRPGPGRAAHQRAHRLGVAEPGLETSDGLGQQPERAASTPARPMRSHATAWSDRTGRTSLPSSR